MVIDLERCMGCRGCMEACKVENNTAEGIFWMNVHRFEEGDFPNSTVGFLPINCQQCDNPPCVTVCPTQARYKQDDGLVATDTEKCIGCRYCEVACPYGVNCFNWKEPEDAYYFDWKDEPEDLKAATGGNVPPWKNPDLDGRYGPDDAIIAGGGHSGGVVEKCTFCVQRLAKDVQPACVAGCPVSALEFGDLDDHNSSVSKTLRTKATFRLKEELNTKPRVHFVGQLPGDDAEEIEPVLLQTEDR
jgi:molybdopterin-containing oxidoreductase family iron-sulfur binding subunit